MNVISYNEFPELFDNVDLEDYSKVFDDHRRGSNFYRYIILEITEGFMEDHFPNKENPQLYIGFWKSNTIIWDDNYGKDDDYSILKRVIPRVEIIEKTVYEEVK